MFMLHPETLPESKHACLNCGSKFHVAFDEANETGFVCVGCYRLVKINNAVVEYLPDSF